MLQRVCIILHNFAIKSLKLKQNDHFAFSWMIIIPFWLKFQEHCFQGSNWQYIIISQDNGLATNRHAYIYVYASKYWVIISPFNGYSFAGCQAMVPDVEFVSDVYR